MSGKDSGGPAFPVVPTMEGAGQWGYAYPGSLRDWFAGQALIGLSSSSALNDKMVAEYSYGLADAMLAERSKP